MKKKISYFFPNKWFLSFNLSWKTFLLGPPPKKKKSKLGEMGSKVKASWLRVKDIYDEKIIYIIPGK